MAGGVLLAKIGKGIGTLAKGALNFITGGGGGESNKTTNVDVNIGDLLTGLTGKEKRQAKKQGVQTANIMEWLKNNWWMIAIPLVVVITVIWLVVRSKKKSSVRSSRSRRSGSPSKPGTKSISRPGVKPNPKGTAEERAAWGRKMRRLRAAKRK